MLLAAKQLLRLGVAPEEIVALEGIASERGVTLRQLVRLVLTKEIEENRAPSLPSQERGAIVPPQ